MIRYLPPKGTAGLLCRAVSRFSRVPRPPAMTTARVSRIILSTVRLSCRFNIWGPYRLFGLTVGPVQEDHRVYSDSQGSSGSTVFKVLQAWAVITDNKRWIKW